MQVWLRPGTQTPTLPLACHGDNCQDVKVQQAAPQPSSNAQQEQWQTSNRRCDGKPLQLLQVVLACKGMQFRPWLYVD